MLLEGVWGLRFDPRTKHRRDPYISHMRAKSMIQASLADRHRARRGLRSFVRASRFFAFDRPVRMR